MKFQALVPAILNCAAAMDHYLCCCIQNYRQRLMLQGLPYCGHKTLDRGGSKGRKRTPTELPAVFSLYRVLPRTNDRGLNAFLDELQARLLRRSLSQVGGQSAAQPFVVTTSPAAAAAAAVIC